MSDDEPLTADTAAERRLRRRAKRERRATEIAEAMKDVPRNRDGEPLLYGDLNEAEAEIWHACREDARNVIRRVLAAEAARDTALATIERMRREITGFHNLNRWVGDTLTVVHDTLELFTPTKEPK